MLFFLAFGPRLVLKTQGVTCGLKVIVVSLGELDSSHILYGACLAYCQASYLRVWTDLSNHVFRS